MKSIASIAFLTIGLILIANISSGRASSELFRLSIAEMLELTGDYPLDTGESKIEESGAGTILYLYPTTVEGDFPDVITALLRRAVIWGTYRTFIHCNLDDITIVVTPRVVSLSPYKILGLNEAQAMQITTTRSAALQAAADLVGTAKFSDMVGDYIMNEYVAEVWSPPFKEGYWDDALLDEWVRRITVE